MDKLRINPGTIGALWKVKEVVKSARERKIPIRIGVNAASLPKSILNKYGKATPIAMVEAALEQAKILEDMDYQEIVVSLKASDVPTTIEAYKLFREKKLSSAFRGNRSWNSKNRLDKICSRDRNSSFSWHR